jgi:hypothetical protein
MKFICDSFAANGVLLPADQPSRFRPPAAKTTAGEGKYGRWLTGPA